MAKSCLPYSPCLILSISPCQLGYRTLVIRLNGVIAFCVVHDICCQVSTMTCGRLLRIGRGYLTLPLNQICMHNAHMGCHERQAAFWVNSKMSHAYVTEQSHCMPTNSYRSILQRSRTTSMSAHSRRCSSQLSSSPCY